MRYVLYNPKSGNGAGKEKAEKVGEFYESETLTFRDITQIKDMKAFFASLSPGDQVVVCGGDGTLNHFANDVYGELPANEITFYGTGSGNDFLHDIGKQAGCAPVELKPYIAKLPTVTVNGMTRRFVNGIGYGIDGYCCEVADKIRETKPNKTINYTGIAIKGLLFHYRPTTATVTVDGKETVHKGVWLAPTMNGRYFGGGMMPTPAQDRLHNDTVSTLVMGGRGRLRTLIAFPTLFKGEHLKYTDMGGVYTGKHIKVAFDRPTALQIDGETVLNVTEYTVDAPESRNATAPSAEKKEKEPVNV